LVAVSRLLFGRLQAGAVGPFVEILDHALMTLAPRLGRRWFVGGARKLAVRFHSSLLIPEN
jgi:hypothetical protein